MLPVRRMPPRASNPHYSAGNAGFGGCARGRGSPLYGDTAIPPSNHSLQSPSSPASGLPEQSSTGANVCSSLAKSCPETEKKLHGDLDNMKSKKYVGVRVRMTVKDILRNIRKDDAPSSSGTQESAFERKSKSKRYARKERVHPFSTKRQMQAKETHHGKIRNNEEGVKGALCGKVEKEVIQNPEQAAVPSLVVAWTQDNRDTQTPLQDPNQNCILGQQQDCRLHDHTVITAQLEGTYLSDCDANKLSDTQARVMSPCSNSIEEAFSNYYGNPSQNKPSKISHLGPSRTFSGGGLNTILQTPQSEHHHSPISFFEFQVQQEEHQLKSFPLEMQYAVDENGKGLIHKAVLSGRRALVYALAKQLRGLNNLDIRDGASKTALHLATEQNQQLMVQDLISLGANVNEQESSGKTPLHLCAESGFLRVLEIFRENKDGGLCLHVDATDSYGLTPLQYAVRAQTESMQELQRNDLSIDDQTLQLGRRDQFTEAVRCLLQMGANPQVQASCPLKSLQYETSCPDFLDDSTDYLPTAFTA